MITNIYMQEKPDQSSRPTGSREAVESAIDASKSSQTKPWEAVDKDQIVPWAKAKSKKKTRNCKK